MSSLLPVRHPKKDFFILDVSDASPKDDMASMEHPVFSLSVKPDMRELSYEHNGQRLRIVPSGKGLATIMDKDILLYCISKLVHQMNAGLAISQWVELTAHEVMVATNWRTNRESYQRFEDALIRLRGTTIVTDIPTNEQIETEGFGLIDQFKILRQEDGTPSPFGRMTRVQIKVSDWTFRAVQGMEVLTISPQYFRLRRPLERRIYELARKHVGDQGRPFRIGLLKLREKVGSNSPPKKFRFFIKQISQDGHIPQYALSLEGDTVVFTKQSEGRKGRQGILEFEENRQCRVSPECFEKARKAAPGYDIQGLYQQWRVFAEKQSTPPRNADAAFIGFCKRKHRLEPLQ